MHVLTPDLLLRVLDSEGLGLASRMEIEQCMC